MKYNETKIEAIIPSIKIEQLGMGCFVFEKPKEEDRAAAKKGLDKCAELMSSGEYDMVILDEITIALYFKLFAVEEVVSAIHNKNPRVEVIMTGRYAPQELYDIADLVTEMKEVKHYYTSDGVLSREGIDK
jgi:cob(I)alamin adenosyltransferase